MTIARLTFAVAALLLTAFLTGCTHDDDYPLLFGNGGSPTVQTAGGNGGLLFGNGGTP